MSDALADVALLRAAGYYQTQDVDPDEDMSTITGQHPISKLLRAQERAARPGAMPPVAETVDDLVKELATVRGLLKALTNGVPSFSVDGGECCAYCVADVEEWPGPGMMGIDCDPARHAPDCPWRLAKEYMQEREAKSE